MAGRPFSGQDGLRGLFDMGYRSPPIPVRFEGFEGTTTGLQRCGWELSCDEDFMYGDFQVAIFHRHMGVVGLSERVRRSSLMTAMNQHLRFDEVEPIYIRRITQSHQLIYSGFSTINAPRESPWHAIDAEPMFLSEHPVRPEDLFMFRPASAPAPQEIIADPETVADLMEKIIKLQKPDMDQIRERNRRRDSLTPQITHAKIISFKEAA